jgi:hypothetical protein
MEFEILENLHVLGKDSSWIYCPVEFTLPSVCAVRDAVLAAG